MSIRSISSAHPSSNGNDDDGIVPQLPASTSSSKDSNIPVLQLGESMTLEHLGPVIINVDGTTRRIQNWDNMTAHEREVTWRRISKRNQQRRDALLQQQQQRTATCTSANIANDGDEENK